MVAVRFLSLEGPPTRTTVRPSPRPRCVTFSTPTSVHFACPVTPRPARSRPGGAPTASRPAREPRRHRVGRVSSVAQAIASGAELAARGWCGESSATGATTASTAPFVSASRAATNGGGARRSSTPTPTDAGSLPPTSCTAFPAWMVLRTFLVPSADLRRSPATSGLQPTDGRATATRRRPWHRCPHATGSSFASSHPTGVEPDPNLARELAPPAGSRSSRYLPGARDLHALDQPSLQEMPFPPCPDPRSPRPPDPIHRDDLAGAPPGTPDRGCGNHYRATRALAGSSGAYPTRRGASARGGDPQPDEAPRIVAAATRWSREPAHSVTYALQCVIHDLQCIYPCPALRAYPRNR